MGMVEFLQRMVRIDSSKKENYPEVVRIIREEAERLGLPVKIVEEDGMPHLIIGEGERIVLTHYDVVPGDDFSGKVKDGKVFGRGAADCKGNIAAALYALAEVWPEKKFRLIVAGGEETQEAEGFFKSIEGREVVVLDASREYLTVGARGVARLHVKVRGKQAHSAYPFLGENPIYPMAELIGKLKEISKELYRSVRSKYGAPPGTPHRSLPLDMSVTVVRAGEAANVIPGEAEMTVDIRFPPDADIEGILKGIEEKLEGAEVTSRVLLPGWVTPGTGLAERLAELTGGEICVELGGTDGVHLYERIPELVQFGVIRQENNIHGSGEFVYIKDLEDVRDVLKRL